MRFGGHETFHIREGWLHKGLKLLDSDSKQFHSEYVADYLGVGRNMAKAIKHWLVATGLAEFSKGKKTNETPISTTSLGELVLANDPFFSEIGTLWALHINLVHNPGYAYSWSWFFNKFNQMRFEKSLCLENLRLYMQHNKERMPSMATLERDLSCMLATYSRRIPSDKGDPEDSNECPLIELGLLRFYRDTGSYQVDFHKKDIPPEIFGYALSMAFGEKSGAVVKIKDAVALEGAPGRVFCMNTEELYELSVVSEEKVKEEGLKVVGIAGEKAIQYETVSPYTWLDRYYQREGSAEKSAQFSRIGGAEW